MATLALVKQHCRFELKFLAMKEKKNKKKFSILRVIFITSMSIIITLGGITLIVFYPLFESNKLIVPQNKNSTEGLKVLRKVEIQEFCDPIPCNNTYIVHSKSKKLEEDFNYCAYKGISGNVFFDFKDSNSSVGSVKYCNNNILICNKDQILTEYTVFDAFLFFSNFMKKEIDIKFYSCN